MSDGTGIASGWDDDPVLGRSAVDAGGVGLNDGQVAGRGGSRGGDLYLRSALAASRMRWRWVGTAGATGVRIEAISLTGSRVPPAKCTRTVAARRTCGHEAPGWERPTTRRSCVDCRRSPTPAPRPGGSAKLTEGFTPTSSPLVMLAEIRLDEHLEASLDLQAHRRAPGDDLVGGPLLGPRLVQ